MTSTPIQSFILSGIANKNSSGNFSAGKSAEGFADLMQKAESGQYKPVSTQNVSSQKNELQGEAIKKDSTPEKTVDQDVVEDSTDNQRTEETDNNVKPEKADNDVKSENTEQSKTEVNDEQTEELKETVDQILKTLAQELGTGVEEIISALQSLNLQLTDLTSPGNMTELVAQVKGVDATQVVTDSEFFTQVTNLCGEVTEQVQKLTESLDIPQEQLTELLKQNLQEYRTGETFLNTESAATPEIENTGISKDSVISQSPVVEIYVEKKAVEEQTPVVKQEEAVSQANKEFSGEMEQKGSEDHEKQKQESTSQTYNFQNSVQTFNSVNAVTEAFSTESFTSVQTREIIDQIAEYVKVNVKPEMSQMEIQLNPANLGSVNLQVVSKEGSITAQFTAQNEAVKHALETQLVQLKQTLEEQGIKVSAIEVTIASHEFEQNMSEQGKENENTNDSMKKQNRRQINLGDEDIDLENSSEGEQIQIDMMRKNGNSLDYQV